MGWDFNKTYRKKKKKNISLITILKKEKKQIRKEYYATHTTRTDQINRKITMNNLYLKAVMWLNEKARPEIVPEQQVPRVILDKFSTKKEEYVILFHSK